MRGMRYFIRAKIREENFRLVLKEDINIYLKVRLKRRRGFGWF